MCVLNSNYMTRKQRRNKKRVRCQKTFCRPSNIVMKVAARLADQVDGSVEEKEGQLELICKTEKFKERFPGFRGKDIAFVAKEFIK